MFIINQILTKNLALRILLIALSLFAFSVSAISISASPIVLEQSHYTGILKTYTYNETESSFLTEVDRTSGLSRVLSENGVQAYHELLVDVVSVAPDARSLHK